MLEGEWDKSSRSEHGFHDHARTGQDTDHDRSARYEQRWPALQVASNGLDENCCYFAVHYCFCGFQRCGYLEREDQ